jgi:uracil-DNA glycosylase family 4
LESDIKKLIIESVKDQQSIFGDDLFVKRQIQKSEYKDSKAVEMYVAEKAELPVKEKSLFMEDFQKAESLDKLYELIHTCQKCPLGSTRNKFVFGDGNPNADVMLIGEAPGAEEDKQGIPFVGRAGKLLDDILKAINFSREEVYIANIIKCRPPQNRNPLPNEMQQCMPYLHKQIELIKPKVILGLGLVAGNTLLNKNTSLTKLRGNIYDLSGIKVMVTYHPAALLRNPNWKRGCWEDVKKFRKIYEEIVK